MNRIVWDIEDMGRELSSPYNDGFTTFEIKKKLYNFKLKRKRKSHITSTH